MNTDESRLNTVVKGTAITCAASTFLTGIYSILRGRPGYGLFAASAAVNSAMTASVFFGFREYIVTPGLSSITLARQSMNSEERLSVSDMRMNSLLDSGISGAVTGAILRGFVAGRRVVPSAAITAGIGCTLLQWGYNELCIQRIRWLSNNHEPVPSKPVSFTLLGMIGVTKLSDEEYIVRLKAKRDILLAKIQALEKQMEDENKSRNL